MSGRQKESCSWTVPDFWQQCLTTHAKERKSLEDTELVAVYCNVPSSPWCLQDHYFFLLLFFFLSVQLMEIHQSFQFCCVCLASCFMEFAAWTSRELLDISQHHHRFFFSFQSQSCTDALTPGAFPINNHELQPRATGDMGMIAE